VLAEKPAVGLTGLSCRKGLGIL